MKFIISERQREKIATKIVEYLDDVLTPHGGWLNPADYNRDIEYEEEVFLFLSETNYDGEDAHMYYSTCDNPNLDSKPSKDVCPFVTIPKDEFETLSGFFNDLWVPVFIKWFNSHTGLSAKNVFSQDWYN